MVPAEEMGPEPRETSPFVNAWPRGRIPPEAALGFGASSHAASAAASAGAHGRCLGTTGGSVPCGAGAQGSALLLLFIAA